MLIAALMGLVDGGPGTLSADHALGMEKSGPAWAMAALGAGALASVATIELARRHAPAPEGETGREDASDQEELAPTNR